MSIFLFVWMHQLSLMYPTKSMCCRRRGLSGGDAYYYYIYMTLIIINHTTTTYYHPWPISHRHHDNNNNEDFSCLLDSLAVSSFLLYISLPCTNYVVVLGYTCILLLWGNNSLSIISSSSSITFSVFPAGCLCSCQDHYLYAQFQILEDS